MWKVTLPFDFSGARYGLMFMRSVAHTDNERLVAKLRKKGLLVESVVLDGNPGKQIPVNKGIDAMTLKELEAYATEKGIDLQGKTKKAEIFEIITAAINQKPPVTDDGEGGSSDGQSQ